MSFSAIYTRSWQLYKGIICESIVLSFEQNCVCYNLYQTLEIAHCKQSGQEITYYPSALDIFSHNPTFVILSNCMKAKALSAQTVTN